MNNKINTAYPKRPNIRVFSNTLMTRIVRARIIILRLRILTVSNYSRARVIRVITVINRNIFCITRPPTRKSPGSAGRPGGCCCAPCGAYGDMGGSVALPGLFPVRGRRRRTQRQTSASVEAFRNCHRQRYFTSNWRGIGYSFQLAITAPLYSITGYCIATAQSCLSKSPAKLVIGGHIQTPLY